jgi:hypothetical protein
MTAQEKSKDLMNKFYCKKDSMGLMFNINWSNAKECALIAVREIINEVIELDRIRYWKEVERELNKL